MNASSRTRVDAKRLVVAAKYTILIALALLLAGCLNVVSGGVRMNEVHQQIYSTVGVINLLDKQPRIQYRAQDARESVSRSFTLTDWSTDTFVRPLVTERLATRDFAARQLPATDALADAYTSSTSFATPQGVRETLAEMGKRAGVDLVVVVYRQSTRDFISDSNENVVGYGVFNGHNATPHAFAVVYVEAIDVNHGRQIAQSDGFLASALGESFWRPAMIDTAESLRLTEAESVMLRATFKQLISDATRIALQEAGLSY